MRYFLVMAVLFLVCCKKKEITRGQQIRQLVNKVGTQDLPYKYDLKSGPGTHVYQTDTRSIDTLFFNGGLIGGLLPDTANYFGFVHYQVGDLIYPFVSTFDKSGNRIDQKRIGVGACGGLTIDIDTCVDRVTINKRLEIESLYKVIGTAEDSTSQVLRICNLITGKGRITNKGKIEYAETKIIDCN